MEMMGVSLGLRAPLVDELCICLTLFVLCKMC